MAIKENDNLELLRLRNVNDPAYGSVQREKSSACTAWMYAVTILILLLIAAILLLYFHIREHKKSEKSIILIMNAIDRIDRVCECIEGQLIPLLENGFPKYFEYSGTTHENKAGREPDKGSESPGLNISRLRSSGRNPVGSR